MTHVGPCITSFGSTTKVLAKRMFKVLQNLKVPCASLSPVCCEGLRLQHSSREPHHSVHSSIVCNAALRLEHLPTQVMMPVQKMMQVQKVDADIW